MERTFENKIKRINYNVYKAIVTYSYKGKLSDIYRDAPQEILPGPQAEIRCCIYKERAILSERFKLAMCDESDRKTVKIIDIACDECPSSGIEIGSSCRSCITHRCKHVCPKNAISIINKKAVVDHDLCVECGECVGACPFNAIKLNRRPCIVSCEANAISLGKNQKAAIDYSKCVECGKCIVKCPFGAISNVSLLLKTIDLLKNKQGKVYAIYAPSLAGQFSYAVTSQLVAGMKKIGFDEVINVAVGAEEVLRGEVKEADEAGVLLSSCCPAFVKYVKKNLPFAEGMLSKQSSPMITLARRIKAEDKNAKIVFISPCTAKINEIKDSGCVDSMLSFEELQAYFDALEVDVSALPKNEKDNSSYYGRIFARSGGLAEGVKTFSKKGLRVCVMQGLKNCKYELLKLKAGKATAEFFEGMGCDGGCVNGALCNWRDNRSKSFNCDYSVKGRKNDFQGE